MAGPDKVKGTQLYIKIGDGGSPEVFTHRCLINTKRGIKFQSSTNKIIVPDCDNPDDPAWQETLVDGLNAAIDGAGKTDASSIPFYDAWYRSGAAKTVQVWLGTKGYWQGEFKLTSWDVSGDRNDYCETTQSLESDGPVNAWVPQP